MTAEVASPPRLPLETTRVEEAMHRGVVSCPLETPLRTVARMMAAQKVHSVVGVGDVADSDTTLWGLVTDRDVLAAAAAGDIDSCDVGSCVGTDLVTISPESTVLDAAKLMNRYGVSHVVVVRPGSDKPLGVLSTLDVAAVVAGIVPTREPSPATRVDQLMTTPVVTVSPETPLKDAAALLVARGISGLPVVRDGEVVGVLSEGDIVEVVRGRVESGHRNPLAVLFGGEGDVSRTVTKTVEDVMTSPAVTIAGWQAPASAALLMTKRGIKRLPVLVGGRLAGIVSRRDLVRAFTRSDAEIARDINEDVLVRKLWLVPGDVSVEVHDGEVSLSGTVESEVLDILVDEVRKVPGVVSVSSTVTVRD